MEKVRKQWNDKNNELCSRIYNGSYLLVFGLRKMQFPMSIFTYFEINVYLS